MVSIDSLNMHIKVIAIGKTDSKLLNQLINEYVKRLNFYIKFTFDIIPNIKNSKNLSRSHQKQNEGKLILNKVNTFDTLILLDKDGKQLNSLDFAKYLQKHMNSGLKQLVFIIGGPYGFSEAIYARANGKLSLSRMTFSHQMVRLFFVEQLYRGFTILKNEPYHH